MDNGEPRCIAFGGLRVDDAIEGAGCACNRLVPFSAGDTCAEGRKWVAETVPSERDCRISRE